MARKKTIQTSEATAVASPINLSTHYLGRKQHAIDGSNRIMLLSEWRSEGSPTHFFVVLVPKEDHLVICSPKVFEEFLAERRAETADRSKRLDLERELNDYVRQVSLDRFGRLPLPPEFLIRARIEKQGELVGRFDRFEIWPCDRYEALADARKLATADSISKLQDL